MAMHTPIPTRTAAKSEKVCTTIKPDIYMTVNSRQRQRNLLVLDLLQGSFTDDAKERQFLDLGCGTGDFTRDHFLPRCPKVERLVAVDVSEEMVEYAREHFAHPMICYDVLDIAAKDVTEFVKRYGQFDRVYSFYCFNWTRDQEAGFRNIAELLKPGGGCLLVFGASGSIMRLNQKLAAMDRWQKYRNMFDKTIPSSVDLVDQDALLSYLSGLLKNASLIPTTCEVLQVKHTCSSLEEATWMLMGMNCISTLVTEEEKPFLLEDVAEITAKWWAERDTGGSLFNAFEFLVRAHKPRL